MRESQTRFNPTCILILIGSILGGLAAPASAQPFSVDVRFSHTHQSEGSVVSGPIDLLDEHYGGLIGVPSSLGGEFQDAPDSTGSCDWQGWTRHDLGGTGNFSQIKKNLGDEDPCYENSTCQVVFFDDGIVEPKDAKSKLFLDRWTTLPGGQVFGFTTTSRIFIESLVTFHTT